MISGQAARKIKIEGTSRVDSITVRLVAEDAAGAARVTDVQLQGGPVATAWTAHASELPWSGDD